MNKLTWSEGYALAAAAALLAVVWLDNAVVMLAVSAIGLAAGLLLLRKTDLQRAGVVAVAAFAVAAAIGVWILLH